MPGSTIQRGLWVAALALRLVAVVTLVAGPWTDEPDELSGWDAQRFQEIAERRDQAWVDQPIEYPPGSVVLFDLLAGPDVVATNRTLILVSFAAELLALAGLWRVFGQRAATAFLVLGTPLVPMGLMRLDMLVTVMALAGVTALLGARSAEPEPDRGRSVARGVAFSLLVAAGALIKLWPALAIAAALAIGRRVAAAGVAAVGGLVGVAWLLAVGAGLEPLDQVLSLRGATGWHVESLPGALVALFGDEPARAELNAFRIGTLRPALVTTGRVLALSAMAALALVAGRQGVGGDGITDRRGGSQDTARLDDITRFSLVMLGSVAALLATAPLLSPQFLLWLTPWGALLFSDRSGPGPERRTMVAIRPLAVSLPLAMSLLLTGAVLTIFGPDGLDTALPAGLLTIRNLSLLAVVPACLWALRSPAAQSLEYTDGKTR